MPSHVLAALFFERYVRYFGSLHPAFEMSCDTKYLEKNSFWFFRKRALRRSGLCTFFWRLLYKSSKNVGQCHQNQLTFLLKRHWGQPKVFALSYAWLVSLVVNENCVVRSSRDKCSWIITYFCLTAVLGFGCAIFRTLRSALWLFTSCVWDVLRYRILRKNSFWFFRKPGLRRFGLCAIVLMIFVQNRPKNNGPSRRKENTNFPKWRWVRSTSVCLSSAFFVSCN